MILFIDSIEFIEQTLTDKCPFATPYCTCSTHFNISNIPQVP